MSAIRVRKNLLGETAPETFKKELNDLLQNSYYTKINSRPIYQRHIRWSPSAMNEFVGTVMNNGLVPGLIMYQLASDEKIGKNEGKSFEMVDGQHRLYTLKAFVDSTIQILPHIKNPFIVYWNYEVLNESGETQYSQVFYKETTDVIDWCRANKINPQYLTDEEREYFDHFCVNLTLIRSKLSLNQRREIFMSLQKGVPVRNSDFLKNKTDCKLVAFMSENCYEEMMTNVFLQHCHKKAGNYWVHWVSRCFLLFKRFHRICHVEKLNSLPISESFLLEDKQIKKLIEINSSEFNPKDFEIIHDFDDVFRAFIEFLQKFDEGVCLNPTQIFALFYVLCDDTKNVDTILSHIPYLSREGYSKDKRTMWESKDEKEPRRVYFNKCVDQLASISEPAQPYDDRQISKAMKKRVWQKCVDNMCEICEDKIDFYNFEAGHIISRACGGQVNIDNLIPICFNCNRAMGTRNAYEFKRDEYPYTIEEVREIVGRERNNELLLMMEN
jgi:5-methylcytosine-specific restriction endonuclease McrA